MMRRSVVIDRPTTNNNKRAREAPKPMAINLHDIAQRVIGFIEPNAKRFANFSAISTHWNGAMVDGGEGWNQTFIEHNTHPKTLCFHEYFIARTICFDPFATAEIDLSIVRSSTKEIIESVKNLSHSPNLLHRLQTGSKRVEILRVCFHKPLSRSAISALVTFCKLIKVRDLHIHFKDVAKMTIDCRSFRFQRFDFMDPFVTTGCAVAENIFLRFSQHADLTLPSLQGNLWNDLNGAIEKVAGNSKVFSSANQKVFPLRGVNLDLDDYSHLQDDPSLMPRPDIFCNGLQWDTTVAFRHLTSLNVANTSIANADLAVLFGECLQLTSLDISGCRWISLQCIPSVLLQAIPLITLAASDLNSEREEKYFHCKVTPLNVNKCGLVPPFDSLSYPDSWLDAIGNFKRLQQLRVAHGCKVTLTSTKLAQLANDCPYLTFLDIASTRRWTKWTGIDPSDFCHFAHLKTLILSEDLVYKWMDTHSWVNVIESFAKCPSLGIVATWMPDLGIPRTNFQKWTTTDFDFNARVRFYSSLPVFVRQFKFIASPNVSVSPCLDYDEEFTARSNLSLYLRQCIPKPCGELSIFIGSKEVTYRSVFGRKLDESGTW